MKLLDMYEGFSIVQIHWGEMRMLVEALDAIDPGCGTMEQYEAQATMQAFFEAAMYAGRLQVKTGDLWDEATLRKFRCEKGIRDWQPSEMLYNREPLSLDTAAD